MVFRVCHEAKETHNMDTIGSILGTTGAKKCTYQSFANISQNG